MITFLRNALILAYFYIENAVAILWFLSVIKGVHELLVDKIISNTYTWIIIYSLMYTGIICNLKLEVLSFFGIIICVVQILNDLIILACNKRLRARAEHKYKVQEYLLKKEFLILQIATFNGILIIAFLFSTSPGKFWIHIALIILAYVLLQKFSRRLI